MSRGILDAPEEQHMYTDPDGEKCCLFYFFHGGLRWLISTRAGLSGLRVPRTCDLRVCSHACIVLVDLRVLEVRW